ncbi:MAG: hypothetical protein IJW92_07585 [Clostridia bacterium]|nr:hypothetical protein [Clostridia bacterium]
MNLTEKTAYLKGLADGLEYDKTTKEGKIIAALLDLVNDMASEIAALQQDIEEIDDDLNYLDEYVEELDDDLQAVEDFLDGEDEEDDDDDIWSDEEDWDEDCDGDCENCDGCECDNEDYYEIVCPSCGETVCFDQELDPENLICPACGEKFGCIVDEEDFQSLSDEEK